MPVIEKKLSSGKTIFIEVPQDSGDGKVGKIKKTIEYVDEAFDKLIQNEITEYCNILVGAFEGLKKQAIPPKKANAEFGLQGSAEGNVYLAKISAQANFKVSLEWELSPAQKDDKNLG
jgi:hypothetical protein